MAASSDVPPPTPHAPPPFRPPPPKQQGGGGASPDLKAAAKASPSPPPVEAKPKPTPAGSTDTIGNDDFAAYNIDDLITTKIRVDMHNDAEDWSDFFLPKTQEDIDRIMVRRCTGITMPHACRPCCTTPKGRGGSE